MRAPAFALLIAVLLPSAAHAQAKVPAEPMEQPSWSAVRSSAESAIKPTLFDPESAQIEWISGFEWGYSKPIIGKRNWGWVGCISLNAKNRMGGYVGAEHYWVLYKADGKLVWGPVGKHFTQCDTPSKVALQPELVSSPSATTATVADELTKLAALLDNGVITRAEFDAQKAKLLNP